ncbi:MAG: hypothetical protein K9N49_01115 [Candidatus Marinimicrobia bacterium]|nr:hypothetical protein [Candidatus Neomarinimicrobiota bacterium]
MKRTLFINEDDSHFTSYHPRADMTREGIERLADFYCDNTQVAGVLFCVNYQKALYKSAVWEYLCDGYDPGGPDDQLFLRHVDLSTGGHGRHMLDNMLALDRQGLDRYQLWIDRCRRYGVEGWLTLRMNDCHGLQEYRQTIEQQTGAYHGWALMFPSQQWKAHPEWRRATYREERSLEGAFDFGLAEVRRHHLKLVAEALEKWDLDGIELDWLRWGMHFRPGCESECRVLLTGFMEAVRALVREAEHRLGHPVKLGVRIPAEIEVCEALGYDPLVWATEKLADQVTLSSFGGMSLGCAPIALWRRVLGDDVRLLAHCCGVQAPYTALGLTGLFEHDDLLRGEAAALLNRGVDGLYFFNKCYEESSRPAEFKQLLQTLGAAETLRDQPRAHLPGHGVAAPGVPARGQLPVPLTNPSVGYDYARLESSITLRLDTGFVPALDAGVMLYLGFSETIELAEHSELRINGRVLARVADTSGAVLRNNQIERCLAPLAQAIPFLLAYRVPPEFLHPAENVVELSGFTGAAELRWAELGVRAIADRER